MCRHPGRVRNPSRRVGEIGAVRQEVVYDPHCARSDRPERNVTSPWLRGCSELPRIDTDCVHLHRSASNLETRAVGRATAPRGTGIRDPVPPTLGGSGGMRANPAQQCGRWPCSEKPGLSHGERNTIGAHQSPKRWVQGPDAAIAARPSGGREGCQADGANRSEARCPGHGDARPDQCRTASIIAGELKNTAAQNDLAHRFDVDRGPLVNEVYAGRADALHGHPGYMRPSP